MVHLKAICLDLDDTILDEQKGRLESRQLEVTRIVEAYPGMSPSNVRLQIEMCSSSFWGDPEKAAKWRLDMFGARVQIIRNSLLELGLPDETLAVSTGLASMRLREQRYQLVPQASEVLNRLRETFPRLALLTNGSSVMQRGKIQLFELEHFFDHIQIEGEFGVGKPDARAYRHVLNMLGVNPEEALMVGDNYEADVLGALTVGMAAIWANFKHQERPAISPAKPFQTIQSFSELLTVLAR